MDSKVAENRSRPTRRRLRIGIVGMPWVDAAIDAGQARALILCPLSSRGLGRWEVPVDVDEDVVAVSPFRVEDVTGEPIGIAALVVKRAALPTGTLDAETREALAQALADSLLKEVK